MVVRDVVIFTKKEKKRKKDKPARFYKPEKAMIHNDDL